MNYSITNKILIFIIVISIVSGCSQPPQSDRVNTTKALSTTFNAECYDKAKSPAVFEFPKDSGPHESFQTEWWYYAGNLKTIEGRHFGYQLTFFRQALSCESVTGASKWRTRQLYFAHFAISDINANIFHSDVRMARQSLDLAGAKAQPYKIWIDNWCVEEIGNRLVLSATGDMFSIELFLNAEKPIVLQGDQGVIKKGSQLSNAAYYYSLPRLKTHGIIHIGSDMYKVVGQSFFDHEWGTQMLGSGAIGWDWFSVHLDDGRDLMLTQIRNEAGKPNKYSYGSISFPDGTYKIIKKDGFSIKTTSFWQSKVTGKRYPGLWEIEVPGHCITMTVKPMIQNQEHTQIFSYWEGAARFLGKGYKGLGYVELVGY